MRKIIVMLTLALFVMVSMPTITTAGATKGQKLFKKKFRKKCGFSGVRFARHHTQSEWEDLYDDGKFPQEAKRICPRLKLNKVKPSWWGHVYEFSVTYAKDGIVPKC